MPGDDDDDFDYTTTDVGPREPDRFEKRGKPDNSESGDERSERGREIREHG
jgi:hypothetical protein